MRVWAIETGFFHEGSGTPTLIEDKEELAFEAFVGYIEDSGIPNFDAADIEHHNDGSYVYAGVAQWFSLTPCEIITEQRFRRNGLIGTKHPRYQP